MKISKILSAVSAMAVAASMAIPAAAGKGAPIGVPDNWTLDGKKTLATRTIIGKAEDNPLFPDDNTKDNIPKTWDKLFPATIARVTIQGDYFGEKDWDASGSIVITGHMLGWGQIDWQLGAGNFKEDGTINPEKNEFVNKIYVKDNNKYTIEVTLDNLKNADSTDADISNETGLYTAEKSYQPGLDQDYANFVVQSFNEDATKSWNIIGFELADANGNSIVKEGDVAMGDVYDPAGNGGAAANNNGGAAANNNGGAAANNNGGAAANNSGSSSSSSGSKSGSSSTAKGSDTSSKTGAASGLALAGIALAGAAFVISKKK